ncbi:hypothetical protein BaRGS_00029804 [Batillaria attramentaria]|uniref:Uncharacterized protein n=1 Tax=Batillaria attramentaria TaxID=370345 RepID=A0ABD0JWB4_9CAEN
MRKTSLILKPAHRSSQVGSTCQQSNSDLARKPLPCGRVSGERRHLPVRLVRTTRKHLNTEDTDELNECSPNKHNGFSRPKENAARGSC